MLANALNIGLIEKTKDEIQHNLRTLMHASQHLHTPPTSFYPTNKFERIVAPTTRARTLASCVFLLSHLSHSSKRCAKSNQGIMKIRGQKAFSRVENRVCERKYEQKASKSLHKTSITYYHTGFYI